MLQPNPHTTIRVILTGFSVLVIGCGPQWPSGEWQLGEHDIDDQCGIYKSVLKDLTEGDGTKTLTFSDDYTSLTLSDEVEDISCVIDEEVFTCTLPDAVVTDLEALELIAVDELNESIWDATVTRFVDIGGSFESKTEGNLVITVGVDCTGSCPAQVNIAAYGIVDRLPCSSTHTTAITAP